MAEISKSTNRTFGDGLRQKQVTILPDWMLKLLGGIESRYGSDSCVKRVRQYGERLNEIQETEVLFTEDSLHPVRRQAAVAVAEYVRICGKLEAAEVVLAGDDPDSVRTNRANAEKKKRLEQEMIRIIFEIVELNEQLIHSHTVLEQRIMKAEHRAAGKINAYVSGVSRHITDFRLPEILPDDKAKICYFCRHQVLDEQIREISISFLTEGGDVK